MGARSEEIEEFPDCPEGSDWDSLEPPSYYEGPDGEWVADCSGGFEAANAVPSGFVALFVLALLGGLAFTVWKVSTARRMARESGMDVGDATAMSLLTDQGFEATYLASNLREKPAPGAAPTSSAADRLRRLQEVRDEGLISEEEYAARRQAIIDGL